MGRKRKEDDADPAVKHLRERQRKNQQRCVERKREAVAKLEGEMNEMKERITRSLNQFDVLKSQSSELITEIKTQPIQSQTYNPSVLYQIEQKLNAKIIHADEFKQMVLPEASTSTPPNPRKSTRTKAVDQSVPN